MSCERWREAISADVDGEDPGLEPRLLEAHLVTCPACRDFRAACERARRTSLVRPAEPIPDLSRHVSKTAAVLDRASRWSIVRVLLATVGLQIVLFSIPALVLGQESGTTAHSARHLGAFTVAYGVGLLVAALRPARARTILPVALVVAAAQLLTGIFDLVNGEIPLTGEILHVPEVISVVLVWMLAVPSPRRAEHSLRHDFGATGPTLVDRRRDAV
jgi:predicted anti-sigma-YlaC factor YlaD